MAEERSDRLQLAVGDVIRMKKKHPCGSFTWEILRTGADLRLRCTGCSRVIMTPRRAAEKNIREVLPAEAVHRDAEP